MKIVLDLCGCRGGAVALSVLYFVQLHEIGLNLESEILFEANLTSGCCFMVREMQSK